jgi:hypothetical protein
MACARDLKALIVFLVKNVLGVFKIAAQNFRQLASV